MFEFIRKLFDTDDFPSRWHCGIWSSGHGWLHIVSDVLVFGAYTAIPVVLTYFILRRKDVPFTKIFWLFALFIFSCGTVHLIEATIFWWPAYRLSGITKAVTAAVSWATVFAIVPVVPKALSLPGLAVVNSRLEAEIDRRTAVEAKLAQRNTELHANKADIELLLQTVSHDLMSPLVTMRGFLDYARENLDEGRPDQAAEDLQRIDAASSRMKDMLEAMLTYNRIGRAATNTERLDLSQLVIERVGQLRPMLEERSASVRIVGDLPILTANRLKLQEVLENLLINAIKYGCPKPGAEIRVGYEHINAEHRVYVQDDGPGIPEADAARVFEIFTRLDESDQLGTGVGLASVRRIMQLFGGRAWVEPTPTGGATFYIALPDQTTDDPAAHTI